MLSRRLSCIGCIGPAPLPWVVFLQIRRRLPAGRRARESRGAVLFCKQVSLSANLGHSFSICCPPKLSHSLAPSTSLGAHRRDTNGRFHHFTLAHFSFFFGFFFGSFISFFCFWLAESSWPKEAQSSRVVRRITTSQEEEEEEEALLREACCKVPKARKWFPNESNTLSNCWTCCFWPSHSETSPIVEEPPSEQAGKRARWQASQRLAELAWRSALHCSPNTGYGTSVEAAKLNTGRQLH